MGKGWLVRKSLEAADEAGVNLGKGQSIKKLLAAAGKGWSVQKLSTTVSKGQLARS